MAIHWQSEQQQRSPRNHSGAFAKQETVLSVIEDSSHSQRMATIGGFGAILLWSTTIAIVRSLSESIGPVSAAAAVYMVSGVVALGSLFHGGQRRRQILQLPTRYIVGCGALFVGYVLVLFLAIGWARNRQQVLEVGLLNYLWPVLTLNLSVVFLKKKANWLLFPSTLFTLVGIFLIVTQGVSVSYQSFLQNLASNPAAYSLALAAAVCWAVYSNLTRKWAGGKKEGAVVLFLPITAMVLLLICGFFHEPRRWDFRSLLEVLFLGGATYVAYALWDHAMRKGDMVMVAVGSYLTPLFSTIVSCFYLAVVPGITLWVGCGILIIGSVLGWLSVSTGASHD